jgi:hypothetical protein
LYLKVIWNNKISISPARLIYAGNGTRLGIIKIPMLIAHIKDREKIDFITGNYCFFLTGLIIE